MIGFSVDFHVFGVLDLQDFPLGLDLGVVDGHVLGLADDDALAGAVDDHVLDADVADGHFGQPVEEHGSAHVAGGDVRDVDVTEGRRLLGDGRYGSLHAVGQFLFALFAGSLATIEEVEQQGFVGDVNHVDAVDVDVFHHAAASAGTLEAETYVGAQEGTVGHVDVLDAARHLTAHHKAAVAVEHDVVLHDDILAGLSASASVFVLARLDADGIVARIEGVVHNQGVGARLQVERVAVLRVPGVEHLDVVDGDVFAGQGMQTPAGRILERNSLEQNFLALDDVQQYGAEPRAYFVPFFIGLDAHGIVELLAGLGTLERAFGGIPDVVLHYAARSKEGFPLRGRHLAFLHGTPAVARAVEHSVAGDGDVLSIAGRDGRLATAGVKPFERGLDDGVGIEVVGEEHQRVLLRIEVDVAQQLDGAGEPQSFGDDHLASALLVDGFDGLVDGLGIQSLAVGLGAEGGDVDAIVGEGGLHHLWHVERHALVEGVVRAA